MNQGYFKITENKQIAKNIYRMKLAGDTSGFTAPGQFLNIKIYGLFLRRPISLCDLGEDGLTIIYKKVGKGTERMSQMECGETLDILTGLGNGYDISCAGDRPVLAGGGVGVPPLYFLAKELRARQKEVAVILGFNSRDEIFYEDEFKALGCKVTVTTVDGSYGTQGFVTDAFPRDYTYIYTCGPEPMLKAVYKIARTSGQFSFERRMGCGFGACMGCSCKTVAGSKMICKEGPVLKKEEILWEG